MYHRISRNMIDNLFRTFGLMDFLEQPSFGRLTEEQVDDKMHALMLLRKNKIRKNISLGKRKRPT